MTFLETIRWSERDFSWIFDYESRASRSELMWILIISAVVHQIISPIGECATSLIYIVGIFAVIIRLHDVGKSGWSTLVIGVSLFCLYLAAFILLDPRSAIVGTDQWVTRNASWFNGFAFVSGVWVICGSIVLVTPGDTDQEIQN